MAENVSEQFFNAAIKANLAKTKAGFENNGVWIDWNLTEGVLKGNFSIPVEKLIDSSKPGCTLVAKDFLSYLEP